MAVAIIDSRRQRVNAESMISFDGVSQYASAGVNQNVNSAIIGASDWAISFFFYNDPASTLGSIFGNRLSSLGSSKFFIAKSSATALQIRFYGGTSVNENLFGFSIEVGKLYHFLINYDSVIGKITVYVNSVFRIEHTVSTAYQGNSTPATGNLFFGRDEGFSNYSKSFLSHLTFFNRTLTAQEISYIHAQGGLLPASTHAACVAHYPCTQREGNTLFDVVEQYNYAKATALVSYHASLVNFSAAQHTGDTQSAYKDFYTKADLRPYVDSNADGTPDSPLIEKSSLLPPIRRGLQLNGIDQRGSITGILPTNEQGYTALAVWKLDTNRDFKQADSGLQYRGTNDKWIRLFGFNQKQVTFDVQNVGGNRMLFYALVSDTSAIMFQAVTIDPVKDQIRCYLNGRLVHIWNKTTTQTTAQIDMSTFTAPLQIGDMIEANNYELRGAIFNIGIAKGIATPKQIIEMWNNGLLMQPRKEWRNLDWQLLLNFNQIIDNAGTYELENLGSAGGNAVLSGYTAANINPLDPSYALTDIDTLR